MGTKKKVPSKIVLDTETFGPTASAWIEFAETRLVGQPRIVRAFAEVIEKMDAGFYEPEAPLVSILIVGPSGVGKTESLKVLSEFLWGIRDGMIRIDGSNYTSKHDVARISGAPPGYIGYDEDPEITQRKLDKPAFDSLRDMFLSSCSEEKLKTLAQLLKKRRELFQEIQHLYSLGARYPNKDLVAFDKEAEEIKEKIAAIGVPDYESFLLAGERFFSILHIDEIEQADKALYNTLYRVLDEGRLTLSRKGNRNKGIFEDSDDGGFSDEVDFVGTIIGVTSNLGTEEIEKELRRMQGKEFSLGIGGNAVLSPDELDNRVYEICMEALRKYFPVPFLNRFDIIVAARPLYRDSLEIILIQEIRKLAIRLMEEWDIPLGITISKGARDLIIEESSDKLEEGARLLRRKVRSHITLQIAQFRNNGTIEPGDFIEIRTKKVRGARRLEFVKVPSKLTPKLIEFVEK